MSVLDETIFPVDAGIPRHEALALVLPPVSTTSAGGAGAFSRKERGMAKLETLENVTNDGEADIVYGMPYIATVTIEGTASLIFHRWSNEAVKEKAGAAKNSKSKKTDNVESYVYRDEDGFICLPGEYLRQSIIHAAKFRQDPRSPRKSAMDLYKASIIPLTELASLGSKDWDYLDARRAVVQRSAITRQRPSFNKGWKATIDLSVLTPEYIEPSTLLEVIGQAGRLIGVADHRPTYGRFQVVDFKVHD